MGISLPKPVLTQIQERYGNELFRCGSSCVNGYRESMEDAHLVFLHENWGFFGVFDGHVNDQCSSYLETAWRNALEAEKNSMPISDERLKAIALQIDEEWMNSNRNGGSTGTFFIARKDGPLVHLQVGNVGDSRVLASINGVCKPLTEDHKPNNDGERIRIEECGGRVENNRVDGSLAVSRAFGDREYKMSKGNQLEQKVIALADVTHAVVTFGSDDFAVLSCDGVFESNFTNEEVIEFIQEQLKTSDDLSDIAGRVCAEAIDRGSRDNISCVIVQFKKGLDYSKEPHLRVLPGPFSAPRNANFRKVYEMMAVKGNTTVAALLENRYDTIRTLTELTPEQEDELTVFNEGPPATLTGADRTKWFGDVFAQLCTSAGGQSEQIERLQYLQQQVGVPLPLLLSLLNDPGDN